MRTVTAALLGLGLALPAACISTPAHANTDFLGQAQRLLGNQQPAYQDQNQREREAYERGREDQMRREARHDQAYRDRHDEWSRRDDWRDRPEPNGYRAPDYRGYSER